MKHTRIILGGLVAILVSAVTQSAAAPDIAAAPSAIVTERQSFEGGGVPSWVTAEKGKVSISDRHAQDGQQSLRWDWVPGDRLVLKTGPLGRLDVRTGYGGYSRSAFSIRVRPEATQDSAVVVFRFMAGDKPAAHFDYPLVFAGWQSLCYHYPRAHASKLAIDDAKALDGTDHIVLEAPGSGPGGSLYLDAIDFNSPVDYRGGREPVKERWEPKGVADFQDAVISAPATAAELDAVKALVAQLRPAGKAQLKEADVAAQRVALSQKYALKRHADGHVTGKLIKGFSGQITGDMLNLSRLWLSAAAGTSPAVLAQVEELYFLLDDFFREAGAVAQGGMDGLNWYGGRNHAAACFTMAEPLRRTGRIGRVRDCLKYFWGYDSVVFTLPQGRQPMGMDYFRNDLRPLLYVALMHEDPQEVVSHLRAYARRMNVDIWNSIEADGSLYHHGFHYYAYANGAVVQMADLMRLFGGTPFALLRETYEKLRMAAMNMRYYGNLTDLPLPMHGRHPGRQWLETNLFLLLAQASPCYNSGRMDPELAGAYLRLRPDQASSPVFAGHDFKPEPDPQGNLAMNYAGIIGHRRDGWLAQARGYGKYYNAFESYAACNRRGLFMGNGYLTILGTGSPVNLIDSGCDTTKGWDWRHLDGCTSYEAPLEIIANGEGTLGDISDIGFVGGLTHRGTNGLFVMPLHSRRQYLKGLPEGIADDGAKCFAANKTYFFFGRRIVCLGSDINLPDLPYPVQTTLFQNTLTAPDRPIVVDGAQVADLPYKAELTRSQAHTLMDIQGNGYYLPEGHTITVLRQHQKSFAGCDDKPTEGDAATAIIEHGLNPAAGSYMYVVLPKTTSEALASLAEAMAKPEAERPVVVVRRDAAAHIVYERDANSWGCVFFSAQEVTSGLVAPVPVVAVAQPCLVMAEQRGPDSLLLTVCDPDLHRQGNDSVPSKVTLTLSGQWKLTNSPQNTALTVLPEGRSELTVTCQDGKSYEVSLER